MAENKPAEMELGLWFFLAQPQIPRNDRRLATDTLQLETLRLSYMHPEGRLFMSPSRFSFIPPLPSPLLPSPSRLLPFSPYPSPPPHPNLSKLASIPFLYSSSPLIPLHPSSLLPLSIPYSFPPFPLSPHPTHPLPLSPSLFFPLAPNPHSSLPSKNILGANFPFPFSSLLSPSPPSLSSLLSPWFFYKKNSLAYGIAPVPPHPNPNPNPNPDICEFGISILANTAEIACSTPPSPPILPLSFSTSPPPHTATPTHPRTLISRAPRRRCAEVRKRLGPEFLGWRLPRGLNERESE